MRKFLGILSAVSAVVVGANVVLGGIMMAFLGFEHGEPSVAELTSIALVLAMGVAVAAGAAWGAWLALRAGWFPRSQAK